MRANDYRQAGSLSVYWDETMDSSRASQLVIAWCVGIMATQCLVVASAAELNLRRLGGYHTSGAAYGVAVSGQIAYVATSEAGLLVFDISNPSIPRRVGGCYTEGRATGVALSGQYAIVADGAAGLEVIDISNPAYPRRVGGYDTIGTATGVAVSGGFAFVADGTNGLEVIDVRDPLAPHRVGGYNPTGSSATQVVISGQYAFVAETIFNGLSWRQGRLSVIDISDPTNPRWLSAYGPIYDLGFVESVAVLGNYAYITPMNGFTILDITDPTNLHSVGTVSPRVYAHGITVLGGNAYLVGDLSQTFFPQSEWEKFVVIDIRNPTNPQVLGEYIGALHQFQGQRFGLGVAVSGNYGYVADGDAGFQVISVANPTVPQRVGGFDATASAWDLAVSGGYGYVTERVLDDYLSLWRGRLDVIDIQDPSHPRPAGSLDNITDDAFGGIGVAMAGNYAAVTAGFDGLQTIDVSDPGQPTRLGSLNTAGYASGVAVDGQYAYLADGTNGLLVIDLSNLRSPQQVGACQVSGYAASVVVSGTNVFVTHRGEGFEVVDIGDPLSPRKIGSALYGENLYNLNLAISGNLAFVADWTNGLQIIDLTNPGGPQRVGGYSTGDIATAVAIWGDYAYVAMYPGILVIDISDPANPQRVSSYNRPGLITKVVASGEYVYVAEDQAGIEVFQAYRPMRLELLQVGVLGELRFRVSGPPSLSGRIQRSLDLMNWDDWLPVTFTNTPIEIVNSDVPLSANRFYRLVT